MAAATGEGQGALGFDEVGSGQSNPIGFLSVHHVAAICSDYENSKRFYIETLGLEVRSELWRPESGSWKLDLALAGRFVIELFWYENPPVRLSRPEAAGLRHLAFAVSSVDASKVALEARGVEVEPVRIDTGTGKRFAFFMDPDGLPLELYEA